MMKEASHLFFSSTRVGNRDIDDTHDLQEDLQSNNSGAMSAALDVLLCFD